MAKKEQLQKRLEAIEQKVQETFEKMLETSSDEDLKKYEMLKKQADEIQEELDNIEALEEKENLDRGGVPKDIREDKNKDKLSEREAFGKKLVEAVSKGTTFSGLLPRECAQNIQMKKEKIARIRGLCTVHQANGEYTVMVEGDDVVVDYIDEAGTFGETTPSIAPIGLQALKLGAITKVSEEYIADLGVDVMGYIEDKFAKGFAKKEDKEILFGTGTSSSKTKIRGISTNVATGNTVTAASATTVTWAEIKSTIQKLKAYRSTAHIVCSQALLDIVHEFKDGTTYMFPQQDEIRQIMGIPVVVSDECPALAAGAVAMIVGDFSYYHICDRQSIEMRTLNELYAATGQVGIRSQERIDGDIALKDAFAVLKMKASV